MDCKLWFKAIRVPFFTATVIPVLFGYLMAWHDTSQFNWLLFILTLIGAVCIHAGTNLANDFFDSLTGCDAANPNPTPFSGGSRVIQEGLISAKAMLAASLFFFALGCGIGLYLNVICGRNVILILGIAGVFLAFFYNARPLLMGYGSLGEVATGIGFGPLVVMGAYYVCARHLTIAIFLNSIPIGILIALVLLINEFPDWQGDQAVQKKTWVVILGKQKAAMIYRSALVLAYVLILCLIAAGCLPIFCLVVLLSLPLAWKALRVARIHYDKVWELLPANAATIGLHAGVGLLLCLGIVLDKMMTRM